MKWRRSESLGSYIALLKHFGDVSDSIRTPDDELVYLTSELGAPRITLDPLFRRFVSHWNDGPTLDSAYFALEALEIIDPHFRLRDDVSQVVGRLLRECYLSSEGGFWPTPFGRSASLYGTLCAVGVMKSLGGHSCSHRPGESVGECDDYYSAFVGPGFPARVRELVARRASSDVGACYDSDLWRIPCVISTSVASSLLWNVGYEPSSLLEILPRVRISSFLRQSLYTHAMPPVAWEAFRPHPDHERPGMSVTYHALKLAQRLDMELPADRKRIRAFVEQCWTGSGFSATIGESPSMISSYYALSCLQDGALCGQDNGFVSRIAEDLVTFVQSCCQRGVYSISPSLFPNAAATRYAAQILLQGLGKTDPVGARPDAGAVLSEFWKRDVGFLAYPVRVVEESSRVFGAYAFLNKLVVSLAAAFSPLRLFHTVVRIAWAHRRS